MTDELDEQSIKTLADLKVQSMLFDMDIDIEKATLVPKTKPFKAPFWLKNWISNRQGADFDESFDVDQE